jgi:hypothetical protein
MVGKGVPVGGGGAEVRLYPLMFPVWFASIWWSATSDCQWALLVSYSSLSKVWSNPELPNFPPALWICRRASAWWCFSKSCLHRMIVKSGKVQSFYSFSDCYIFFNPNRRESSKRIDTRKNPGVYLRSFKKSRVAW